MKIVRDIMMSVGRLQQWWRTRRKPRTASGSGDTNTNSNNTRSAPPNTTTDRLSLAKVSQALSGLPRVLKLVFDIQPVFTIFLAVFTLAQGILPALTAVVTASLFQAVVNAIAQHGAHGTTQIVIWLVVAQFAIQSISSLLGTLANIVQQLLQEKTTYAVQLQVMEKANTLDLRFFEDSQFYDSLQQAQREASTRPIDMISQTFGMGRTLVTLLSMLFILVHLAWWIAILALLAPIPAFYADVRYGWWGYQLMRRQSPLRREMAYYNTLVTTDTYNKEVKLFALGNYFIMLFRRLATRFYGEARALIVPRYLASFAWEQGSTLVNGLIYLYVALQAVMGYINFGGLALYTQAALSLGGSFDSLLSSVSSAYENNLFINTLFDYLAYVPSIASPKHGLTLPDTGLHIEFRNVSFSYPGPESKGQALHNISFSIQPGEAVALVGSNGAGKTTIVKLLTRLYDPDEGQILINDHDIKEYDLEALRSRIGVIFQDYVTYYLTAGQNIGVGRVEAVDDQDGIRAAAAKSGADAVIEKLPDAYESMLGKWFEHGQQLSGGEWQKIALARAFMRDAQLLILDEPTSSLDPQAEYEVFRHFRELTAGKSAVFISHRFSTVRLANRILVLEHGEILEEGSHSELLAQAGRYKELFQLQAEAYR